jgi:TetR/AcrR family transcriptional regulator
MSKSATSKRETKSWAGRRPGRPSSAESGADVRRKLIATSQRLFAEKGFGEVGLREIAQAAGVTPAMISYYFGDKAGLYEAVFVETLEAFLGRIQSTAAESAPSGLPLERFLGIYFQTMMEQPWLPNLLLREVATRDSPFRKLFVERFAGKAMKLLPALIARQIESGRLRANLDPKHTLLSLLGMTVFPVIAAPVLGPLLGYRLDNDFAAERIEHIQHLFLEGAGSSLAPDHGPTAAPGKDRKS